MTGQNWNLGTVAMIAALGLSTSTASAQEVTLKAASCFPIGSVVSVGFEQFAKRVNKEAKGIIQIKVIGGAPAIGSPFTMTRRMARGITDFIGCPDAYWGNVLPEAPATRLSDFTPAQNRKNGAWELLQEIYAKKAGSHLLSWGNSMTSYNMYLLGEPKLDSDGVPNLKGVKMRATGTYRPLFRALGASTINIKSSELFTALQRGTVAGFGWPDVAIVQLGVHKIVKYRVIPNSA